VPAAGKLNFLQKYKALAEGGVGRGRQKSSGRITVARVVTVLNLRGSTRLITASPASGSVPPDLTEAKRKIDAHSQAAENQREETRIEIDRHRMPRKQRDADEQVERPPEEIHDGGGRAFAAGIGEGSKDTSAFLGTAAENCSP
jgi:hypothetical protein